MMAARAEAAAVAAERGLTFEQLAGEFLQRQQTVACRTLDGLQVEVDQRGKTTHPIGRVGNAEEVATLILYLCSDEAGWVTGANVSIDGGRALASAR